MQLRSWSIARSRAATFTWTLDSLDLLRALAGVANIGLGPDGERAAKNLVDILIAGIRTQA
jgi:hypothetical protein